MLPSADTFAGPHGQRFPAGSLGGRNLVVNEKLLMLGGRSMSPRKTQADDEPRSYSKVSLGQVRVRRKDAQGNSKSIYGPVQAALGCQSRKLPPSPRMLSFSSAFSLSSFTFIKRLFSSSLSTIKVVSSAYLRLLIFLPAILIAACASFSLAFHMMQSAYKINKQGDNIQS